MGCLGRPTRETRNLRPQPSGGARPPICGQPRTARIGAAVRQMHACLALRGAAWAWPPLGRLVGAPGPAGHHRITAHMTAESTSAAHRTAATGCPSASASRYRPAHLGAGSTTPRGAASAGRSVVRPCPYAPARRCDSSPGCAAVSRSASRRSVASCHGICALTSQVRGPVRTGYDTEVRDCTAELVLWLLPKTLAVVGRLGGHLLPLATPSDRPPHGRRRLPNGPRCSVAGYLPWKRWQHPTPGGRPSARRGPAV